MRSAPTLKIWMTPLASVAMLEKLALLKMALCRAPALSRASCRRTSVMTTFAVPTSPSCDAGSGSVMPLAERRGIFESSESRAGFCISTVFRRPGEGSCGPLRDLHELLAEVVPMQHPDEGLRCVRE